MFFCVFVLFFTRFLFLLLGPHGKGPQYHEIGRSMATLMTDEVRQISFWSLVSAWHVPKLYKKNEDVQFGYLGI